MVFFSSLSVPSFLPLYDQARWIKSHNPIEEPNTVSVSPEMQSFGQKMSTDIEAICQACASCSQYGTQATLKPMLSHATPTQPWQFVSQDIFKVDHQPYLITIDHYNDFYELDPPTNTQSSTIIDLTKSHFTRYGIPLHCLTDIWCPVHLKQI